MHLDVRVRELTERADAILLFSDAYSSDLIQLRPCSVYGKHIQNDVTLNSMLLDLVRTKRATLIYIKPQQDLIYF